MRVAVAATPSVAIPTLDWLHSSPHELALVITRPDKPSGRGKVMHESPVAQWARSKNVPTVKPADSAELVATLNSVDLVITIAYGVILPLSVLRIPKFGFINLHFSLLPAWRGAAPVQRAIENGDEIFGVTVFELDEGMDTGPIYVQQVVEVPKESNSGDLLREMANIGPDVISQTLNMIEEKVHPSPQSHEGVIYAKRISKLDAKIDWSQNASIVLRRIRAFTPDPGSWSTFRGQPIQISEAHSTEDNLGLSAGEISVRELGVVVGCGEHSAIVLAQVQPAGKRAMTAKEWANGARIEVGTSFE